MTPTLVRQGPGVLLGLVVNALLLYGVVVWGWSPGSVLLMFPVESIGIGLVIGSIIARKPASEFSDPRLNTVVFGSIFGMFTLVQAVLTVVLATKVGIVADVPNLWLPLGLVVAKLAFDVWDSTRRSPGIGELLPPAVVRVATSQVVVILGLGLLQSNAVDAVQYDLGGHPVTTAMAPVVLLVAVKSIAEVAVLLIVAMIAWAWHALGDPPAAPGRD